VTTCRVPGARVPGARERGARGAGRRRVAALAMLAATCTLAACSSSGTSAGAGPGSSPGPGPGPAATGATAGRSRTAGAAPARPPSAACSDPAALAGPAAPPAGAVTVPAGDNSALLFTLRAPGRTFYFAAGVHTLGPTPFAQIIPGDGAVFVGAPGAVLDGRRTNLYAFTGAAAGVTVEHLTVRNFGTGRSNNDQGVVNHDRGARWVIRYDTVVDNDGAGVMLGSGDLLARNCLARNGQYGFSAFAPQGTDVVHDVVIDHNEISGNNTADWERLRPGCGCTGGGKLWSTDGARIVGNYVHGNHGPGIWADNDNRGLLFDGNYIEGNDGHGIEYEVSYNFAVRHNTFVRNALVKGREYASRSDRFPAGAVYVSESGGDPRAGDTFSRSEITGNRFEDNWDGVVLWENADRFCRPQEPFDTTNGCPWFDKRWGARYRTQNIVISDNDFAMDRAAVGCARLCGRQAIFSNFGTYPKNSPYLGTTVQQALTFRQGDVWRDNRYTGSWRFVAVDLDHDLDWAQWRAAPYGQDAGSTVG